MFQFKGKCIVPCLLLVLSFCLQDTLSNDGNFTLLQLRQRYRLLLAECVSKSKEVSEAVHIGDQARQAGRTGKTNEAKRLLGQAVSILESALKEDLHLADASYTFLKNKQDFLYGIMVGPRDSGTLENIESYFQICKDLDVSFLKVAVLWDLVEPIDGQRQWKGDRSSQGKKTPEDVAARPGVGRTGRPTARPQGRREMQEGLSRGPTADRQPVARNEPERRRRAQTNTREEPSRKFDFDFDYIASLAQKYQISIVPRFLGSRIPGRATDGAGFADFVYSFVKRYRKSMDIQFIEFQNEPNAGNDGSGKGRHWRATAGDLARVNNAVYDKIKTAYPDVIVGTAGFITGSREMINSFTIKFYDAYFKAKPKFDVFMLHEYPKNYNYTQGTTLGDLASQYHLFETYRQLLDRYGYGDKPILITEGYEDKPSTWTKQEAVTLVVEGLLAAKANAESANIIGKIFSGVKTLSKETIGLVDRDTGEERVQYYVLRHLIQLLQEYSKYLKRVAGKINSEDYWVYLFRNENEKNMWCVFAPVLYETNDSLLPRIISKTMKSGQKVELEVGDVSEVVVERIGIDGKVQATTCRVKNGKISFTLDSLPVFVLEKL